MAKAKLTAKQQRFVEEYLVDLNATQAAIRAGYSKKTAQQIGAENLSKPVIASALKEAKDKRSARTEITQDAVLNELGLIGFSNMMDYVTVTADGLAKVDLTNMTRDQAAALGEITSEGVQSDGVLNVVRTKIKLTDKRPALVDIGKHLGMFKDQLELVGKDGESLSIDVTFAKNK